MAEKSCYFCGKSTHVSEYCRDFSTLRERYSVIFNRGQSNCLCPEYVPTSTSNSICRCKIICAACFQHHHIAVCPKRDPEHPSNPVIFPEPLPLFSHPSHFAQRFLELCDPINQHKLRRTCKYFLNHQSVKLKLKPEYYSNQLTPPPITVFNKSGIFVRDIDIAGNLTKTKCLANFDSILLDGCYIRKKDLKILAKNEPFAVALNDCTFESDLEFQEFLDAFPYTFRFHFVKQQLPWNLMLNFLCSTRKVGLREIIVRHDDFMDIDLDDMVLLYEQNENLVITMETYYSHQNPIIDKLKDHIRFIQSNSQIYDLCCFAKMANLKHYFRFI